MRRPETPAEPTQGDLFPIERVAHLSSPLRRLFYSPKRLLGPLVSAGDTAVDLGCGPGYYTLPLARMVGEKGRVIAVDVQQEMLSAMTARAKEAGLAARIEPHLSRGDSIGVTGPVDFALAFWVLHEAPDQGKFLQQAHDMLRPGGRLLLVEPLGHVTRARFTVVLSMAAGVGLELVRRPHVTFSRAALLTASRPDRP
jgi:SAM-dependent methyltransferase